MAAGIHEPTGTTAGRVTIVTTLASLLPTIVVCAIIVIAFLVQMISAEIAAAMLLTALGLGSSISSTVFATAKKTPTDQARLIWGSQPVSDAVTAPPGTAALPEAPAPAGPQEAPQEPAPAQELEHAVVEAADPVTNDQLAAEVEAVRARRSGSTTAGGLA